MPSSEGTFSVLPEPSPKKRDFLPCSVAFPCPHLSPQEQSPGLEDSGGTVFFETAVWASDASGALACLQEAGPHSLSPPLTLWVLGARGAPRALWWHSSGRSWQTPLVGNWIYVPALLSGGSSCVRPDSLLLRLNLFSCSVLRGDRL